MTAQYGDGSAMILKEVRFLGNAALGEHTYGIRADGDCLAPFYKHGDLLLCDPDAEMKAGDFVTVWWKDGKSQPASKRLLMPPPPKEFLGLGGDAIFMLVLEQLNPLRIYQIDASKVGAIHKILGKADEL